MVNTKIMSSHVQKEVNQKKRQTDWEEADKRNHESDSKYEVMNIEKSDQ